MLQEKQRSVVDRWKARAEAAAKAQLLVLLLDDLLLILPLDAKGRIREHVVELLAREPVARLAVAERVAEH